jgi:preprotein translocase subunit SecA
VLRAELTQFERWVLLQIVDQAWKDHLYSMDQVKESIGFRSFSQKDPRIEFKREAGRLFDEMEQSIREKVTDLIFKARLTPQVRPPQQGGTQQGGPPPQAGAPAQQPAPVQVAQPAIAAAAAAVTATGTATQRRDLATAEAAGTGPGTSRKAKTVRRASPAIGRNEPCPCKSGKKYKNCCGGRK